DILPMRLALGGGHCRVALSMYGFHSTMPWRNDGHFTNLQAGAEHDRLEGAMTRNAHGLWLAIAMTLALATPLRAQEVWKGAVKQNSGASHYTVVMKLSDKGGETEYPELKCGGVLTRVGQSGDYAFYLEKITTKGSNCIDGAITLVRSNDMIAWGW